MGIMDLEDKGAPADDAATREPAAPEQDAAPAEPTLPAEPVAVAIPPRPESRSARAARETRETLAELKRRDGEREQQLAQLREIASRPQYIPQTVYQAPPQQQQPNDPDPDELFRQSRKALDAKDYDEYERLQRAGHRAETTRILRQNQAQMQPQQQYSPPDPILTATLARYPEITNSGQAGIQLAIAEDARLSAMGHPPGWQRFNAAFAAASETIKGAQKQAGPQYDRSSAAALSSSPTGRGNGANGNGHGAPALMLDPDMERTMRAVAKKAGMTWDAYITDYAAHHPELLRR